MICKKFKNPRLVIFLLCFTWAFAAVIGRDDSSSKSKYKVCILTNDEDDKKGSLYCSILNSIEDSEAECVFAIDRLDCMQKVIDGKADFGIFKAEDLLLASSLKANPNLMITNEMRLFHNDPYEFDMVVLISNEANITSLADLERKRLCHPGFDEDGYVLDWSEVFSQYFEETVVPQICNPKLSALENRIKSLVLYFDSSCKPGVWSPDSDVDNRLKYRYGELCDICYNPNECSRNDLYWGRTGTLNCLTDCRGDVAWARLQDIPLQFKETSLTCHDVSFLCPDGSTEPLKTQTPCVWISRPWPVIVSRQTVASNISQLIKYLNKSNKIYQQKTWESALRALLGYSFQPIYEIPMIEPMKYLESVPGFMKANNATKCKDNRRIDICVKNEDELEKCQLMARVATVFNVQPDFGCILSKNCVGEINSGTTDVVIVNTEQLMIFKRYSNLKTILYETTNDFAYLRHSSAVVNANSKINTLADLKGKKACFTSVNGLGWNSFVMAAQNLSLLEPDDYPYTTSLSKFFSDICVVDNSKSNTIRSCYTDELPGEYPNPSSLEWNETEALQCLANGGGDVAFINFNSIDRYLNKRNTDDWTLGLNASNFRQICPTDDLMQHDCYLTWAAYGQIMVQKNTSVSREEEITSAFLTLSLLFGERRTSLKSRPLEQVFKLFAPFGGKEDILFQDAAKQLQTVQEFKVRGQMKRSNFESNVEIVIKKHSKKMPPSQKSFALPTISFSLSMMLTTTFLSLFVPYFF